MISSVAQAHPATGGRSGAGEVEGSSETPPFFKLPKVPIMTQRALPSWERVICRVAEDLATFNVATVTSAGAPSVALLTKWVDRDIGCGNGLTYNACKDKHKCYIFTTVVHYGGGALTFMAALRHIPVKYPPFGAFPRNAVNNRLISSIICNIITYRPIL